MALGRHEGISLKDLTIMVDVNKSLTTRIVKQLIEKGLVENKSGSAKTYSIYLTDKGKDARELIIDATKKVNRDMVVYLSDDEKKVLKGIMEKIRKKVDEDIRSMRDTHGKYN